MKSKFVEIPKDHVNVIYRVRPKLVTYPAQVDIRVQSQNLFQGTKELLGAFQEDERGPKTDSKGNVLKYSLVGSVKDFIQEKQKRLKSKTGLKQLAVQEEPQTNRSSRNSFVKTNEQMTGSKHTSKKNRNKDYELIQMNEQEVQTEIKAVKSRLMHIKEKNDKSNKSIKQRMNPGDSLKMDNFERVLDQFENTQNKWQMNQDHITSQVKRNAGESINDRIDQFRAKQEIRQLLEHIRPPEDKYGNNFWKLGLRQPYHTLSTVNPYKYIGREPEMELIRKSSSIASIRPYTSFTTQKFMDKKFSENQDTIKKLIPTQTDFHDLAIQGTSKLNDEIQSLHQAKSQQVRISGEIGGPRYIKKIPIKHEEQASDEVVAINYDRKRIIQSGKFGEFKKIQ
ncbi:hypothetical protein pb186bvf_006814 [Paramecium bursaria]